MSDNKTNHFERIDGSCLEAIVMVVFILVGAFFTGNFFKTEEPIKKDSIKNYEKAYIIKGDTIYLDKNNNIIPKENVILKDTFYTVQ